MATATAESRSVSATGDGHKHKKNALSDGQGRLAWILLAPTLLVIIVVAGIPVLMSIRESFFRGNTGVDPTTGLIAAGESFVGLQNFTAIFSNPDTVLGSFGTMDRFSNAFLNTTAITIVCVILETILGVIMALIMSKAFRGRGIVRAGILVPVGHPDHRVGADVEADLRLVRRDEPDPRQRDPLARRLGSLLLGRRDRRRLEDRAVHRTADPRGSADHPGRGLRGGEGGRGHGVAAVHQDHAADGQADAGRRGALPHARHPADVRPALRHDRPGQVPGRDPVDLLLPGSRRRRVTARPPRTRSCCSSTCSWSPSCS